MATNFKKLQNKWYEKLEKSGFVDIENTSHESRPLKEWHSFKMVSKRFQMLKAKNALYQKQIIDFLNHESFDESCKLMIKHGNCRFSQRQVRKIWELHVEGLSDRRIAKEMKIPKSTIQDAIKGLRTWMRLTL